ncbi:hypothetical protein LK542_20585 [Massilia sp. IC2-477]|uniref:lysozyme inhibitor LprI family protein n=1 Tax=Massilia sp. IC2-477 TaxID=2887198 RepID=UPI001D0FB881|nr:hypothetical protein [Massilia sp. IC2-477]MCC2958022.1 hypothetical protein [Massilia sp. IC2-477]
MTPRRTPLLLVFSAVLALPGMAAAATIDCTLARSDIEQAICAHQDLLAKDRAISQRLATLGQQCPANKALLAQGQTFWLRERWDCRNGEGALGPSGKLAACLGERMDKRLHDLGAVRQGCDFSSLAGTYRFVDPGYLRQFSRAYVGKPVAVFGWMDLGACHDRTGPRTVAELVGQPGKTRFPVRFSSMPDQEKDFLCAQQPAGHWQGVVKDDGQGAYLYLTDILGQKLAP